MPLDRMVYFSVFCILEDHLDHGCSWLHRSHSLHIDRCVRVCCIVGISTAMRHVFFVFDGRVTLVYANLAPRFYPGAVTR